MKPTLLRYQPETEFFTEESCHITELSNSTEDDELSVALVRVEPGVTTQWHRLQEICERYVICSGQGIVEIADLPPQNVEPNDVVIIPPGCQQRITNSSHEELIFYALCTPRFRASSYQPAC